MPFNAIHEYDAAVAGNNTDIGGSNIAEGCAPSGINNALRELARQVRAAVANQGADIVSATTTSIGAATGQYVRVTGTTTITAFGTVNGGVMRWVEFTGALTLTHNAGSLRLPGASNIVTAAGDVGLFVSLGAGNWKCLHYSRADGSAVTGFGGTLSSTDASAAEGPDFVADRASASPAASDIIGAFVMRGRDSGGSAADYAKLKGKILDATNGSEDGAGILSALVAGTDTPVITFGPGVQIGAPTGGDLGAGTLNVDGDIYKDGVKQNGGTVILLGSATNSVYTALSTQIPLDDTPPQNTEGDQILAVTVSPRSASSTLEIEFCGIFGHSTANQTVIVALFVDATANALNATGQFVGNTGFVSQISLKSLVSAGSVASRTYKIRAGSASTSDAYLNGDSGGRNFGGIGTAVLTVKEILP